MLALSNQKRFPGGHQCLGQYIKKDGPTGTKSKTAYLAASFSPRNHIDQPGKEFNDYRFEDMFVQNDQTLPPSELNTWLQQA